MNLSILKLVYDVFGASADNSALTSDAASAPKPRNSIISPDLIALKAPSKEAKDKFLACNACTAVTPEAIKKVATIT